MIKGLLQTELFYCNHLGASENDEADIMNFTIDRDEGMGLLNYIQHRAFPEEEVGIMRTYIVRDIETSELVGYFSLKAGLVSHNEREIEKDNKDTGEKMTVTTFDTLPGVELANFAVNSTYIHNHEELKGVGKVIFNQFVLPIVRQTAENIGMKVLYIFALPYDDLIKSYHERYGFSFLKNQQEDELHRRLKPFYDQYCKFMFMLL